MKKLVAIAVVLHLAITFIPIRIEAQQEDYHSYDSMKSELSALTEQHPDIISVFSIGTTYKERDILAVKISDNPNVDEPDEQDVLYMGAHHGNEKTSYEVLIYFINYLAEKYTEESEEGNRVRWVVNNRELYIVPMVNPDGVDADTRKNTEPNYMPGPMHTPYPNCYGVDLNRNYDYMWGRIYPGTDSANPYSDQYQGEAPFSEKETQATRDFASAHDFVISLSYHTYGELILYPWGYTSEPPDDEDLFVSIGNNISAINGYEAMQAYDLYPTSGDSDDWLYGEKGVLAFTIELGSGEDGHSPPMDRVLDISRTHVLVNLYVAEITADPRGTHIIQGELLKKPQEAIFEATPATFAIMGITMLTIFGITYGGLFKCIRIAIKAERKKYGAMEE